MEDAVRWKHVFDAQAAAGAAGAVAGMTVKHVWRSVDMPDPVFFTRPGGEGAFCASDCAYVGLFMYVATSP